jgi:transcriptional regulator
MKRLAAHAARFDNPTSAAYRFQAMHPNPAFRESTRDQNLALARARGFGVLTVNGPEGPLAAHIPFQLSDDATTAELHLARSNAIVRAGLPAPALLAIAGPDAYVSPDWYGPHDLVPDQVPTWNYVAVHLRGVLEPLPEDALRPHVDALSAEHEARIAGKTPWTSAKMTEGAMPRMMRMILPFRLRITSVEGTWKLNQNKPDAVRARAADALAQGDPGARAIAELMRKLVQG